MLSEPTACGAAACHLDSVYCSRCDLLVGLDGLHVTQVDFAAEVGMMRVRVESPPTVMGCHACGLIAHSHGRRDVTLIDPPCFGRAVRTRLVVSRG